MHLSHLNYALWFVTTGLDALVCALAYRGALYRRLPFFTAYLTLGIASTALMWVIYGVFGFGSWTAYDTAWTSTAVLLAARALVVVELCSHLLRAYRGIWALSWRLLVIVSILFPIHAGAESAFRRYWLGTFVLGLDRDLELTATAVLVATLVIGRYYTLEMDSLERRIAGGLCLLSLVAMMTNAMMVQAMAAHLANSQIYHAWLDRAQPWWNSARSLASVGVLGSWAAALRQPVPPSRPAPTLLPVSAYREISHALNVRLRALDARLLEVFGP